MDTNTQLEGILFSGENVLVSVFDELTTFTEQGKVLNSRVKEYSREMGRPTNISLDSFLFGEVFNSDAVHAVRRYQFDNERDKKKCTSLKVACLAAKLRDRSEDVCEQKEIKKRNGFSFLILAHCPKRNASRPLTKNDLQGSMMIMNFVDSAFSIGMSRQGMDIRYIKQLKARNNGITYGKESVLAARITKDYNFLRFEFLEKTREVEQSGTSETSANT